ncbi:MAG: serine/threonine phosphatase PrpC [Myxococcales bacterium]|nr:serine/threonine phosphatase PrpC [Myxococcales bacterium]
MDDLDRRLVVCGGSAAGGARAENQDTFVIADLASGKMSRPCVRTDLSVHRPGVLLVVCDGATGQHAGKVAAHVAARAVKRELEQVGSAVVAEPALSLDRALVGANHAVAREAKAQNEERRMETTCTAAVFGPEHLAVAQVGDSRAYLLRDAKLGRLTHEEPTRSPLDGDSYRDLLTQTLGADRGVQPLLIEIELCEGDRVLLCSKGLHGVLSDEKIASILRDALDVSDTTDALIAAALDADAADNVTVVIAECGRLLRQ